jgi:hypothetical protein
MSIEMLQIIIIYKIIYVTLFGKEIYEFKMNPIKPKKKMCTTCRQVMNGAKRAKRKLRFCPAFS